jgi:hypothetical protein
VPGLVPGIRIFSAPSLRGAQATKQSIYPLCRAMDCFAAVALLRCGRNCRLDASAQYSELELARDVASFANACAKNFFIIFIDGIFTTFIEWPFTNVSHAIRKNRTMSCV